MKEVSETDTTWVPLIEPTSELPVALSASVYHAPVAVENDAEASVVVAPLRISTEVRREHERVEVRGALHSGGDTDPTRRQLPKALARTLAATVAVDHDVEPASALPLALVPDCEYTPDDSDQLPPEVLQPLVLPSLKSSENSVAALAAPAKVTMSAVTAAVTPVARATRACLPSRR